MATRLTRFRQRVKEVPKEKCTALMGLVFDTEELRESFERQDVKKAPGERLWGHPIFLLSSKNWNLKQP